MKYFIILFLFLAQITFGQPYYPLNIGNEWQYDSSATALKVVSDSLFANGKTYYVLNRPDYFRGQYVRVDSHFVYYYNSSNSKDVPFYKLDGKQGDTTYFDGYFYSFSYAVINNIDTIRMFGEETRIIHYQLYGSLGGEATLSEKFGPISAIMYCDLCPPWDYQHYDAVGCIINGINYGYTTSVKQNQFTLNNFRLYQNYPNPFNPVTTIEFSLSHTEYVRLDIIDFLGREIATIVSENLSAGQYQRKWDAGNYASGVYLCRLMIGNRFEIKKLILLR